MTNLIGQLQPRSRLARQGKDRFFVIVCIAAAALSVAILLMLLVSIVSQGWDYLTLDFIKNPPSRKPKNAGIYPSMIGSIWICALCALTAIPIGVGTAIFLEEFKPRSRWLGILHRFIEINITNLAGVPSIVYGILGRTAFVQVFNLIGNPNDPIWTLGTREDWYYLQLPFGRSVLAGGLTLMLVVLPIIIIASQEALRAVPDSLRKGSLALGATPWQTVWKMTLPSAVSSIMTGAILAISRAIGEAAPVLVIAGIVYITFTPEHMMDDFTVMPLQIYNWASQPKEEFHRVAAAGILVLLSILLTFNALAVFIRYKFQRPLH